MDVVDVVTARAVEYRVLVGAWRSEVCAATGVED